jgi:hypothetical protein
MATPILALMPVEMVPPLPPRSMSLYTLEDGLQALLDSAEMVTPEEEAEFAADLEAALAATVQKRDRVGWFMAHIEGQTALAAAEIKRLQTRKAFFEAVLKRVETSVVRTIRNLGMDAKSKYKALAGETVTFSVRRCPATVAITDEAAVPVAYKSVSITLPAITWEALLDSLDIEARIKLLDEVRRPDSSEQDVAEGCDRGGRAGLERAAQGRECFAGERGESAGRGDCAGRIESSAQMTKIPLKHLEGATSPTPQPTPPVDLAPEPPSRVIRT